MSLRKDSQGGSDEQAPARPPFRRVLVANRGEIALRIIRACHAVGAEAVAVYSDADATARHVRAADAAVNIGPSPASESYLRVDAIVDAARQSGAEAVHPGYGFLSEQPALAEACSAAGIVFVGPTPATLAGLGDKLAARRTAASIDVPTVPGLFEPVRLEGQGWEHTLATAAGRIGFPLLVKAAAGGGGRGMRRVDRADDLAAGASSASREALAAFGDGSVYLERLVENARHVEVQLLGDGSGSIVALGERDCSVQRRHQKLVEEAPAPGLSAARRAELHESGRAHRRSGRPDQRRDGGVPAGADGRVLVPGGQRAAAGRARGDRTRDRPRHRRRATLDRRRPNTLHDGTRGGSRSHPAQTPRHRGAHQRRGSGPRLRAGPGQDHALGRAGRRWASGSTRASSRGASSARTTTRCWPSCWWWAPTATLPLSECARHWKVSRWVASRRPCPSTAGCWNKTRSPHLSGLSTEIVDRTWEPAPIVQRAALRAAELALSASLDAKSVASGPEPAAAAWWQAGVEAELQSRL